MKARSSTLEGVVKKQKRVFAGRELARNDTLIKDYGITGDNVLHLVLWLSDLLHITVRTIGGKELDFHVDPHRNVGYLRKRIVRKGKAYDPDDQELFCNGEKLDDQRLIDDICKNIDDVIHLVVQKTAKVRARHFDKDLELSVVAVNSNDRIDQASGVVAKNITWGFRHPDFFLEPVVVNPKVKIPSYVWDMLKSTFDGLEKDAQPIRYKCEFLRKMHHDGCCDFEAVLDLLLQVAVNENVKPEHMIKKVLVFGYREPFTNCCWEAKDKTINKKYMTKGYGDVVPHIVYWKLLSVDEYEFEKPMMPRKLPGVTILSTGYWNDMVKLFVENNAEIEPENVMEFAISGEEYQTLSVVD